MIHSLRRALIRRRPLVHAAILSHQYNCTIKRALSSIAESAVGSPSSSSSSTGFHFPIGQGHHLIIRLQRAPVHVQITSAWIDHTELCIETPAGFPALVVSLSSNQESLIVSDAKVTFAQDSLTEVAHPYQIIAKVPEKINLNLALGGYKGDVKVTNKVEGDVEIMTKRGNILASKLRGPRIELEALRGLIAISRYAEGDLILRAKQVQARMLKGNKMKISVSEPEGSTNNDGDSTRIPVDIEALFGNLVTVTCTSLLPEEKEKVAVQIARSHGDTKVVVRGGGVRLGGVNGSATVQTVDGPIDVRFEALEKSRTSLLASRTGPINVLVSPDIKANVCIESTSLPRIDAQGFESEGSASNSSSGEMIMKGRLTGRKTEPSRHLVRSDAAEGAEANDIGDLTWIGVGKKSGKIDLQGAEEQALKTFFNGRGGDGGGNGGVSSGAGEGKETEIWIKTQRGKAQIKTLSWMDAIKKEFGLEHINYDVKPKQGGHFQS